MEPMYSVQIPTNHGEKTISVFAADILSFDQQIDILTTSAFYRSYHPTPGTLFHGLDMVHVSVQQLVDDPEIDLRNLCNVWLSRPLQDPGLHIRRIGCVEMMHQIYEVDGCRTRRVHEQEMLQSLRAYFQMLDVAATCGVKMDTVAVPVLGSGSQHISTDLILIPLINECVQFLKRNTEVRRVFFIERNQQKAYRLTRALENSYSITNDASQAGPVKAEPVRKPLAFISYQSGDRHVADDLCAKLEARGIQVWYAPRNVHGAYASAIVEAIMQATHFVVILSKNSMASEHVLNEIDLAFRRLPNHIKFTPLRIDAQEFAPAFDYYLSRQHWMEANVPPLEQRLNEFVDYFLETL